MKLLIHELQTTLRQKITVGDKPIIVEAIRPYLYKHNAPAGDLTVKILDDSLTELAESDAVTITDISGVAFFHGLVRFDISVGLERNTDYWIELVPSGGYSFSESAYVGWNLGFDLGLVDSDYTPSTGLNSAFIAEIWERKAVARR